MNRPLPGVLVLLLLVPVSLFAQVPAGAASPASFALDPFPPAKSLHFLAGMALGLAAAGIVDAASDPGLGRLHPAALPLIALTASAAGGVAKEVLDSTGFGDPRFTDILITMTGGLAAALAAAYAQGVYPPTSPGRADGTSFLISMAVGASLPVVVGFVGEIRRFLEKRRSVTAHAGPAAVSTYADPLALSQLIAAGTPPYFLVDVRTAEEYAMGHIPTAVNIPLADIRANPPSADKEALIIVYCASGNRSRQARAALEELGYRNVVDFGAIGRWTGEVVEGEQPGACPCPPAQEKPLP